MPGEVKITDPDIQAELREVFNIPLNPIVYVPDSFNDGQDVSGRMNDLLSSVSPGSVVSLNGHILPVANTINITKRVHLDWAGGSFIGLNQFEPLLRVYGAAASGSRFYDVHIVSNFPGGRVDPSGLVPGGNFLGLGSTARCSAIVVHDCNRTRWEIRGVDDYFAIMRLGKDTTLPGFNPLTSRDRKHYVYARDLNRSDFGILAFSQDGLELDIQGDDTTQLTPAAPHLVYFTDKGLSRGCKIRCESRNNTKSTILKLKSVLDSNVSVVGEDSYALFSADADTSGLVVEEARGYNMSQAAGTETSIVSLNGTQGATVRNVHIEMAPNQVNLYALNIETSADHPNLKARDIVVDNFYLKESGRTTNAEKPPVFVKNAEDIDLRRFVWDTPLPDSGVQHDQYFMRLTDVARPSVSDVTVGRGSGKIVDLGTGTTGSKLAFETFKLRAGRVNKPINDASGTTDHTLDWVGGRSPLEIDTTADYTLKWLDAGSRIRFRGSATQTLTLIKMPKDSQIRVERNGSGGVTFAAGAGVTLRSVGNIFTIPSRYGSVTAVVSSVDPATGDVEWTLQDTSIIEQNAVAPLMRIRTAGSGTSSQLLNLGAGTAAGEATSWLYARLRQYGVMTAPATGLAAPFSITVQDETDFRSGAHVGSAVGIAYTVTTGADGPKAAFQTSMLINGSGVAPSGTYVSFVSQLAAAAATTSLTGATGGAFTNDPNAVYRGGLFGGNDHPRLASGAMHWFRLTGRETNVEIEAGASAFQRVGWLISTGSNAASQAIADDVALNVSMSGSIPWKTGLGFGISTAKWSFDASSTLIGATKRVYPSAENNINAAYGVDFREVTFAQAAFASPGFAVGPTGVITLNGSALQSGNGTPEGVITAPKGSIWLRKDGGVGTTLYIKETGNGNTGWTAK